MSIIAWVGVAVLGGAGTLLRFLIDGLIASGWKSNFPVGTLLINVSGALVLGIITGLAFAGDALLLAGTATLGSYTTFSTWMLETHRLREEGEFRGALANVLVSLAVGVGAAALGRSIGARL